MQALSQLSYTPLRRNESIARSFLTCKVFAKKSDKFLDTSQNGVTAKQLKHRID